MTVYVESNFVLEQALEQEQCESCDRLTRLARDGVIRMLIPAFSLAEPHIALMHKGNERSRFVPELRKQLSELARSKSHQKDSTAFDAVVSLVMASQARERTQLESAVDALLDTAEIIPLTNELFRQAKGFQTAFDISFQDSLVLASVVDHLRGAKLGDSCFLSRNTKDFANPSIRDLLAESSCRFFGRFDHALAYIEASLRNQPS